MMELGLIYDNKDNHPTMKHNSSHKFESIFLTMQIPENSSVMFSSLAGSKLGAWVAHGEGKFELNPEEAKQIVSTYSYDTYPGNPNGSDFGAAAVCSSDGRHLAIMPHLERSMFPWNWPYYTRNNDEVTPWIEAFVNARVWLEKQNAL